MKYYNIAVMFGLLGGITLFISLDAPSIRKQMDEDAYILKNSCALLTLTIVVAIFDIMMNYMYPPHIPM